MSADIPVPDIRPGDRITVQPGAVTFPGNRHLARACTLEVTSTRRAGERFVVSGLMLTKLGAYSAAGALDGRNRRAVAVQGTPGDGWDWFGEPPADRTLETIVGDLVAAYGVDRREAVPAVAAAAGLVRDADAGRYGTAGNVPGWSPARNQPTEAGAHAIREALAERFARHAARAASSAVRLGCPRTIDPAGRLVFTDGHGRGWVLQLRDDGAVIVGSIPPRQSVMHTLTSHRWPLGVPALPGDGDIARRHLRQVAEPATVTIPGVGDVPALGEYLRPVALACASAPAGRWLVVVWPEDSAPSVWRDSDESTLARVLANQAVGLVGTRRVYLARRSRYGTTVYARTGEGAAYGTLPTERQFIRLEGMSARATWERLVRGDGASDPAGHAANVLEAQRRTLGLPEGVSRDVVDQAARDRGCPPWMEYIHAFVHVVGDPVGHRH